MEELQIIHANLLPAASTVSDADMILIIQGGRPKRALPSSMKGDKGDNVYLSLSDTHIIWKIGQYGEWMNLISFEKIQEPAKAATDAANSAALSANTAAGKANTATTSANNAAKSANAAAASANAAADRVDESITEITAEKQAALDAAAKANTAAGDANKATALAIEATGKANTATANAIKAETSANNAASAASNAASAAVNAAAEATSATNQTVKATTAANNAAAYANEMADHQPIIGEDGYWYRWDAEQDVYVKTDDYAKGGADYPVFGLDVETMNVTVDAVISNDRYAVTDDGVLVVLF